MCGLHIFCITLLRSQVCICCILPGSMRNKKDQRRNISISFGRCVPCRQHSLRCYSHLCTRHVLHVFSSHHEDVSLPRRFHIAGVHLDTHADHLLHPHSAQPSVTFLFRSASFASGPSLHAVARPSSPSSLSVSTCWSASNAHVFEQSQKLSVYLWSFSDPVAFVDLLLVVNFPPFTPPSTTRPHQTDCHFKREFHPECVHPKLSLCTS